MSVLILLFLVGITGITLAQERRPADDPTPPPLPPCPSALQDYLCQAYGTYASNDFSLALGTAYGECQGEMMACQREQAQELAANKAVCESVPGCTLKYEVDSDDCEKGNYTNCSPDPPDDDPSVTIYSCVIAGHYDNKGYRCDRGPAGNGENQA